MDKKRKIFYYNLWVGNGFTLIEIVVVMFILVIVFGLISLLFAKASSVRKIIVVNSEIQQTLSQMMDTIVHGQKGRWGLSDATSIRSMYDNTGQETSISPFTIVAYNETRTETMIVRIASERELIGSGDGTTTLWVNWYPPLSNMDNFYNKQALIDINKKVELVVNHDEPEDPKYSNFTYYDSKNRVSSDNDFGETTLVKINLSARSKEPVLRNKAPVILQTAVKLKNALPF